MASAGLLASLALLLAFLEIGVVEVGIGPSVADALTDGFFFFFCFRRFVRGVAS